MKHLLLLTLSCFSLTIQAQVKKSTDSTLHAKIDTLPSKDLNEITILSSTRNEQRIENAPLKVEVLGREEMEEESAIKPGGIASILGDVSGVQIQQSSAVTGNASVRIQGLGSRYTQILKDGLPLYDGFSGGFGILSIPPLDLSQVEMIKGSASTLYGGGAIGGLINIISRKPTTKQVAVISANQTTLKETNLNGFLSHRKDKMGYTFFTGYTRQKPVDVNKDGFSDVADVKSLVVHPRLFFYPTKHTTIITGYTGTFEQRNGGDMLVLAHQKDNIHQFFEYNTLRRNSAECVIQQTLTNHKKLEFKSSWSAFNRTISNNDLLFNGKQANYFAELSFFIPKDKNSFVTGINITGDQFRKQTNNIPLNNFGNKTIGAFAQQTWNFHEGSIIEAGLRTDHHFTYGNFILPRLAIFQRLNEHWATRAGVGLGYKTPNALSQQNTDFSIQKIYSLPVSIKAERSVGYNAEVNYKYSWGQENEVFINQAFFLTKLKQPVIASRSSNGFITYQNMDRPERTKGSDTYIKAVTEGWEWYIGYTFTIAERKYLQTNQFLPLTPKHRFAFTMVKDMEDAGIRLGIEGSYTGYQYRENGSKTPGYFFMAAMIEKKLGDHWSVVLNGENLLDYRQSKIEALYTGSITNPEFNPLWAPIDGRVINVSLKWRL